MNEVKFCLQCYCQTDTMRGYAVSELVLLADKAQYSIQLFLCKLNTSTFGEMLLNLVPTKKGQCEQWTRSPTLEQADQGWNLSLSPWIHDAA